MWTTRDRRSLEASTAVHTDDHRHDRDTELGHTGLRRTAAFCKAQNQTHGRRCCRQRHTYVDSPPRRNEKITHSVAQGGSFQTPRETPGAPVHVAAGRRGSFYNAAPSHMSQVLSARITYNRILNYLSQETRFSK